MKHLATKHRRRQREKFCYMYRDTISALILHGSKFTQKVFVVFARKTLGYSVKTADCDIWCSISKTYNKLSSENKL